MLARWLCSPFLKVVDRGEGKSAGAEVRRRPAVALLRPEDKRARELGSAVGNC